MRASDTGRLSRSANFFNALRTDLDVEYVLIESTICKAHAGAMGGRGSWKHGIGHSRGGLTTWIHAAVDALGLPVRLIPNAGQRSECPQAAALSDGLEDVGQVIADAAHDTGPLRGLLLVSWAAGYGSKARALNVMGLM